MPLVGPAGWTWRGPRIASLGVAHFKSFLRIRCENKNPATVTAWHRGRGVTLYSWSPLAVPAVSPEVIPDPPAVPRARSTRALLRQDTVSRTTALEISNQWPHRIDHWIVECYCRFICSWLRELEGRHPLACQKKECIEQKRKHVFANGHGHGPGIFILATHPTSSKAENSALICQPMRSMRHGHGHGHGILAWWNRWDKHQSACSWLTCSWNTQLASKWRNNQHSGGRTDQASWHVKPIVTIYGFLAKERRNCQNSLHEATLTFLLPRILPVCVGTVTVTGYLAFHKQASFLHNMLLK